MPMNVNVNPRAMKGPRRRVKSEVKARSKSMAAPVTLGATV